VQTFTIKAKTTSPFITGLGSGHPTETGMILDRNIGVPYIPASSIKGVLKLAYAINIANGRKEVPDSELERYFGTADAKQEKQFRGQLVILDAYPTKDVQLKVDIMNSHYKNYYSGEYKQPVETETPNPKSFLTVKEGTEFCFNCAFMPLELNDKCNEDEINAMFTTAFERVGFGGKTAIGYGRFVKVDDKSNGVEQNNIQNQPVKEVKTLEAGEYKATVNNVDKNRQSIYFEIDKMKEKAVIRNCKQKDYAMYPKKAKVKIKLDGTKNSQDDYIVIEIIEKL
jgi:CRISPR-associated protein Cmr6